MLASFQCILTAQSSFITTHLLQFGVWANAILFALYWLISSLANIQQSKYLHPQSITPFTVAVAKAIVVRSNFQHKNKTQKNPQVCIFHTPGLCARGEGVLRLSNGVLRDVRESERCATTGGRLRWFSLIAVHGLVYLVDGDACQAGEQLLVQRLGL